MTWLLLMYEGLTVWSIAVFAWQAAELHSAICRADCGFMALKMPHMGRAAPSHIFLTFVLFWQYPLKEIKLQYNWTTICKIIPWRSNANVRSVGYYAETMSWLPPVVPGEKYSGWTRVYSNYWMPLLDDILIIQCLITSSILYNTNLDLNWEEQ